jgi:hypothetical protein
MILSWNCFSYEYWYVYSPRSELFDLRSLGWNKLQVEIKKNNKPESKKQQNKDISYKYGVEYASVEMLFLKHRILHVSLANYDYSV